jgi:hypothetical protein
MRRIEADWTQVCEVLTEWQLMTMEDYAEARGWPRVQWMRDPVCAVMAATLAAEATIRKFSENGLTERQSVVRAAIELELDVETLFRRRRLSRTRKNANEAMASERG